MTHIKKHRFALTIAAAATIAVGQLYVVPAFAHGAVPNHVPSNTPSLNILSPNGSTHVHPGQQYSPNVSGVNMPAPPGLWFDYVSPSGNDTGLFVNSEADGTFTVPSSWTAGTYQLKDVYVTSGPASGLSLRDGEYIGFPSSGGPEYGSYWLNMSALDLIVS